MRPVTSKMPPVDRARLIQDLCEKRTVRTAAREAFAITGVPTLTEMLAGLPEVPVVVMLGEQADRGEAKGRAAMANISRSAMQTYPGGQLCPQAAAATSSLGRSRGWSRRPFCGWWIPFAQARYRLKLIGEELSSARSPTATKLTVDESFAVNLIIKWI